MIDIENPGQAYVDGLSCLLEQYQKHSLFANSKKGEFHQDEIWFPGFIISAQVVQIEEKKIEVIKTWLETELVRNTQVFISFANFY